MQTDVGILPLRGATVHEILDNDHRVIKTLLDDLVATQEPVRCREILEQLKGALTIHNAMEENLIYPALDKVAGHMLESQKLFHQTASADVLVFEVDTALKLGEEKTAREKSQKLHDAVFSHIKAEDEGAVPHLKDKADAKETQMLLQAVREFRSNIRFGTPGARIETGEIPTTASVPRV